MNQSEVLGGALIAGFVLYLAMTNRLGVYWTILTGGGSASTAPATPSGGTTGSGGSQLPAPGSSGAPILPVPGTPGLALPANPLPIPLPGFGYPGN